jgi:MFS family permease
MRFLAPIATLLLSAAILLSGQGLQSTLLPVRASLENFPTVSIGWMGAAYFFGFTMGCLKAGEFVRRVGHIRVFLGMGALASATPLLHGLVIEPVVWGVLRFLTGFCLAALYMVIESWLNESANNTNRGMIFSAYTMLTLTMMAVGQMMTLLYEPTGLQLFIIASILFSIGAVPVALSMAPSPAQPTRTDIDLRGLFTASPAGTVGCFVAGLANGSFWSLAPLYAGSIGDAATMAAWFMAAVVIGGAATQWPLGLLSDRFGRRKVLVSVTVLAALAGIALAALMFRLEFTAAIVLAGLWGGFAMAVYSISVAYANDYVDPSEYVSVSAGLLLVYGLGAIAGPFIASMLMAAYDPSGLYWFTACTHVLLAAFVVYRYYTKGTQAEEPIAFGDALSAAYTTSQVYEEELGEEADEPGSDAN